MTMGIDVHIGPTLTVYQALKHQICDHRAIMRLISGMVNRPRDRRLQGTQGIAAGLVWLILALHLAACDQQGHDLAPVIRSVSPTVLTASGPCTIRGARLGEAGFGSIGGVPLLTGRWDSDTIECTVPNTVPGGHRLLVLRLRDGQRVQFPVEVIGRIQDRRPPPRPSGTDMGMAMQADAETVSVDARPPADTRLIPDFIADPQGSRSVRLQRQDAADGRLTLTVDISDFERDAWGIALHLDFDPNLLRFLGHPSHDAGYSFQAKQLVPGRIAIGWIRNGDESTTATFEFELLGPGEGRIEIPTGHRTLRGPTNQPLRDVGWSSGSIRIVEVPR